jgi:hypothetical protein
LLPQLLLTPALRTKRRRRPALGSLELCGPFTNSAPTLIWLQPLFCLSTDRQSGTYYNHYTNFSWRLTNSAFFASIAAGNKPLPPLFSLGKCCSCAAKRRLPLPYHIQHHHHH